MRYRKCHSIFLIKIWQFGGRRAHGCGVGKGRMHQKGGDLSRDRQVARSGGWLVGVAKGMFGCKTVRLTMNWKSGRKNAFLPNMSRVCGFVNRTDVCNMKPPYWTGICNGSCWAPYWNDAKSSISEAVYGKVANILAWHSGVLRAVRGTSNFWGGADEITPNQQIMNWIWGLHIATEQPLIRYDSLVLLS